jgi:hypothetical protein
MTDAAAKTPAQRQASLKARRAAAGIVRVTVWCRRDDKPTLMAFAAALAAVRKQAP